MGKKGVLGWRENIKVKEVNFSEGVLFPVSVHKILVSYAGEKKKTEFLPMSFQCHSLAHIIIQVLPKSFIYSPIP